MIRKFQSLIIPISLLFFAAISFVSCAKITAPDESELQSENQSQLASLNIRIKDTSARAASPALEESSIKSSISKITLGGTGAGTVNETWNGFSDFESKNTVINLKTGDWTFTLDCYIGETIAFTDTVTETLEIGENTISFNLKEASTGNGRVEIALELSSAILSEVSTVDVYFNKLGEPETKVIEITSISESNKFEKAEAPCGVYIAKFVLKDSSGAVSGTVMELVKIAPGFTTTGTVKVSGLSKSYIITYELDGGGWSGSFTAPVSFTNYDEVILPAASNISKEGYKFVGWYVDSAFSGEAISSWDKGAKTEDVTLYAKWIFSSNVFYVNESTGDDDGDGVSTKPFKTVKKAIEKIKEISAAGESHIDGPYKINVTGTINAAENSSVADFAGLGEVTVTIDGDAAASGTKATLKGNGNNVVFISASESNLTLTLKNLIVTGGSAAMGGGVYASAGNITVENCEITGNSATTGGGVYVNYGKFTMSGGTISDNTATTSGGGGVYVASNGTFEMEGAAQISADNDVYLSSGKYITITGALTGTTVATITPYSYTEGTQVLDLSAIEEANRAATCDKFALSDTTQDLVIQPDSTDTTKGVLKKPVVSGGITIDLPGSGTYVFYPTYGGAAVNDGDTLTYKSESSFAVTVTKDGNEITETPTIELRDTGGNKLTSAPSLAGTHPYQLYMKVETGGVVVNQTIDISIANP